MFSRRWGGGYRSTNLEQIVDSMTLAPRRSVMFSSRWGVDIVQQLLASLGQFSTDTQVLDLLTGKLDIYLVLAAVRPL